MFDTPSACWAGYSERIESLRATKLEQTREKQRVVGAMDYDDWALVLPPEQDREVIETISGSGVPITDVLLKTFRPESNHASGGFFGPKACGENYRRLLELHPTYIDPVSSLAGAYMVNFFSYRDPHWNPDLTCPHLEAPQEKYQLVTGIGAVQHFCQDLRIGLKLGFGGILEKIRLYREINDPECDEFYQGLEAIVLGIQGWIERHSQRALEMAEAETDSVLRQNLFEIADTNRRLVTGPPQTFREACQWILWFQLAARMYDVSGSLGRLDEMLYPYYTADISAGRLTREEAVFHLACYLVRDTAYIQVGGVTPDGHDDTNEVSFLILEAAHLLKIPANIGVAVGSDIDKTLLRRAVEVIVQDKAAFVKFLGHDAVVQGYARNGYPLQLARRQEYGGCHWYGIPGREYMLMDCVKICLAAVFDVALREMLGDDSCKPSVSELWKRFAEHLRTAIRVTAEGLDFHLGHMHEVFPDLVLDLCCHGTIERGRDASNGGVEYNNLCVDAAALATVADSFAAIEQRIEVEKILTWSDLLEHLDSNWAGVEGERIRMMMKGIQRYGSGGSLADEYAVAVSELFTELVKERPTPNGHPMIPGLFSWANTIPMGKTLGATPNGRRAGEPISHGANPDPGFRKDGAATALALAVASVQPGFGNAAPLQIEIDQSMLETADAVGHLTALIETHFLLGGTQINMNILDSEKILKANEDPSLYPDLVVRVTGFSAFFASLSPEFRQLVVDRILKAS